MDFKPENVLWSPSLGCGYNLPFPGRMLKADIIKCQTWQIHSLHIFKSLLMISIGNINTKLNSYSLKMYFLSTRKHDVSHVSWTDYFEIGEKKMKDQCRGRLEGGGRRGIWREFETSVSSSSSLPPWWSPPWVRSRNFKCHLWSV